MQRQLIAAVVALALLIFGVLALARWMNGMSSTLASVDTQLVSLAARVDEAEERASTAERRAQQAEAEAAAARREAELAAFGAERAAEEAGVAAWSREEALDAREHAEEIAEGATAEAESARLLADQAQAEAEELRRQRERELARLESALGALAETRRTALGLVMNLGNSVEFDFDKAELRPENRELLSRIAGVLLTASDLRIQVFGHTDDVGSDSYNEELSLERARAVSEYLIGAGLPADIVTVRGFGKSQPLVEGTDDAARQRNRRVEIAVVQTLEEFRPVVPPGP